MIHILIVDDDKNICRYYNALLSRAGYTVFCSRSVKEALSIMENTRIDLILLDIMLPETDGFSFARTLRNCRNEIPILMVTARDSAADVKKGFLSGTDDYMKKPVDEDEMLLRIKGLLRRAKILTDRRLSVGSTVLDYDTLTVRVGSLPGMFKREQEQLMKKKKMKRLYSVRINLFITGFMFLLLLLTSLISNSLFAFLHRNTLPPARPGNPLYPFLVQNACFSIVVGCLLTFLFSHWLLSPLHTLIRAIRGVSEGNFKTKLQIRYPREFRELSRQFNQMTEELSSTELLRSDFVNNFSHEFKTPIVSILGFAKLLKKENLEAEERNEYLDIIIEESNRLASLSSGILNLSKLEKTSLLLDLQTYNISEQIRVAITQLASQWLEKNLSLQLHLDEIDLTGNELLLKEVWLNLLDNAIKFSPKDRTITVFAKADESSALFSIQDQGIGMAHEVQKHIFDKFYQGDPSHSIQGNGLGLPLAKRIVELHHGSIQVQSSPEKGSTFTVVLPLRQSQETSV